MKHFVRLKFPHKSQQQNNRVSIRPGNIIYYGTVVCICPKATKLRCNGTRGEVQLHCESYNLLIRCAGWLVIRVIRGDCVDPLESMSRRGSLMALMLVWKDLASIDLEWGSDLKIDLFCSPFGEGKQFWTHWRHSFSRKRARAVPDISEKSGWGNMASSKQGRRIWLLWRKGKRELWHAWKGNGGNPDISQLRLWKGDLSSGVYAVKLSGEVWRRVLAYCTGLCISWIGGIWVWKEDFHSLQEYLCHLSR